MVTEIQFSHNSIRFIRLLNGKKQETHWVLYLRMWNSSSAVLWNKSSETDFCGSHWVDGKKPIESYIPERMWNSSFAVLWNKSSETDFCRIHWLEWEQTDRVLYLRECGTLLCVLKTICKSTKFCVLLWSKKYGFCAIAAEFWMPWKDHPSLCLTIHGVCVCMIEGREKQISQMSVKEVRSRWPSSTCRKREKQEWELGNFVCGL
jgi:hypothetical protein